jgi:exodeoxyribonuclease-1
MSDVSFFFYDLETSGISPSRSRIMQFAGQRTDADLNPIGQPYNLFIKQTPDILPELEAILLTGILPTVCNEKGITEAELSTIFNEQIAIKNTIFIGFNNLRFDDEFIRFLNYRNFYDPYQWHWANGCSRWDLLDLVRMTRALRPEGISWTIVDGKPSNKLELLAKQNNLDHDSAHDALSDVKASIKLASLIKDKQPKIFDYLLEYRAKDKVVDLMDKGDPFVYTSSHYLTEILHTTVVATLNIDKDRSTALVYDLRYDPSEFVNQSIDQLVDKWRYDPLRPKNERLPFKTIKLNRCPAVAPFGVIDQSTIKRLSLDIDKVNINFSIFKKNKKIFLTKMNQVIEMLDQQQTKKYIERAITAKQSPELKLYDNFSTRSDQAKFAATRQAALNSAQPPIFSDNNLNELYKLYRAINYSNILNADERQWFKTRINQRLFKHKKSGKSAFNNYIENIDTYLDQYKNNKDKQRLLTDLKSYAQSIENDYAAD